MRPRRLLVDPVKLNIVGTKLCYVDDTALRLVRSASEFALWAIDNAHREPSPESEAVRSLPPREALAMLMIYALHEQADKGEWAAWDVRSAEGLHVGLIRHEGDKFEVVIGIFKAAPEQPT